MLVAREIVDERIRALIMRLNERKSLYLELNETYGIPMQITADICANRKDISEESDFIAFTFIKFLDERNLTNYFTTEEINMYSEQKYVVNKLKPPIVFENMVRITNDQWIGMISTKKLMELKDAQLIKYNENTQRTLRRVVKGENKYYKIYLNKKSINEIKESFEDNSYISDDITLNVVPSLMEFSAKKKTNNVMDIIINSPAIMDILDGYHRYIAISQVVREYPDFDYPMELRLCAFTEEKAKQFIYQKDQKTRMKRIDSESMNQYNPANTVVTNLNANPGSNIRGMINRNSSNIDPAFLAAVIGSYYFGERRKYSVKETIDISNDLQQKFNQLTTEDTTWLDHEYTEREIQTIIFCFANGISDAATIRTMINKSDNIDVQHFKLNQSGKVKRKMINELNNRLS